MHGSLSGSQWLDSTVNRLIHLKKLVADKTMGGSSVSAQLQNRNVWLTLVFTGTLLKPSTHSELSGAEGYHSV